LFHSIRLPIFEGPLPFSVIAIELVDEPNSESMIVAFKQGWSHCYLSNCRGELTAYLYRSVSNIVWHRVRICVKISRGIQAVWVSGTKSERQIQSSEMLFEFANYPSDMALVFAVEPAKAYRSSGHFSVQVVYSFSKSSSLIVNRAWRKAASATEWAESLNILAFASVVMKQRAAHELLQRLFERKYSWDLGGLSGHSPQILFIQRAVALFEGVIVADSSPLPGPLRRALMCHVMTRGPHYVTALVSALIAIAGGENAITLPPYVCVPRGSAQTTVVRELQPCGLVTVVVPVPDRLFAALQAHLTEILKHSPLE
jgi:hypothetical protein